MYCYEPYSSQWLHIVLLKCIIIIIIIIIAIIIIITELPFFEQSALVPCRFWRITKSARCADEDKGRWCSKTHLPQSDFPDDRSKYEAKCCNTKN